MQQLASYSSNQAAAMFGGDVNPTTIQRAISRGELLASKGPHAQSRYRIAHTDLMTWAAARGLSVLNGADERVDAATGEVVEPESPAERAMAARQRLAGVRKPEAPAEAPEVLEPVTDGALANHPDFEFVKAAPAAAPVESNVARVLLPAANVYADRLALIVKLVRDGHLEAAQLVIAAWEA